MTSIGLYAFSGCSSLTSIKLPNGVKNIGTETFFECGNLTSIKIPDSVTSIGMNAFRSCINLKSAVISNSVTNIGSNAFSGCYRLTSIKIPNSVTSIGSNAFSGCSSLIRVTMLGETPPTPGSNMFSESGFVRKKVKAIYVPKGKTGDYQQVWAAWKDYIYIPENLSLDPTSDDYADSVIEVQGFTVDTVVYSVDVEWGAMTFQWKNALWDPVAHKKADVAGWNVYDSSEDKALDGTENLINEIKVTNHSNAEVWAMFSFTSIEESAPDTTGSFEPENLHLKTADNDMGVGNGVGEATVGKVYFMPVNLKKDLQEEEGITKWKQIGTITVGVVTEYP